MSGSPLSKNLAFMCECSDFLDCLIYVCEPTKALPKRNRSANIPEADNSGPADAPLTIKGEVVYLLVSKATRFSFSRRRYNVSELDTLSRLHLQVACGTSITNLYRRTSPLASASFKRFNIGPSSTLRSSRSPM